MRDQLSKILPLILIVITGILLFNTFRSFTTEQPKTTKTAPKDIDALVQTICEKTGKDLKDISEEIQQGVVFLA